MVFFYFILFCAVGSIGAFLLPPKRAGIGFVVVALVWATIYGPFWAIVSLVEMGLGYVLTKRLGSDELDDGV